jgi:hypothetical protein
VKLRFESCSAQQTKNEKQRKKNIPKQQQHKQKNKERK